MSIPEQIINGARRLRELRDNKEEIEDKLKEINKEIYQLQIVNLPKYMEDAEIEKVSISGVGTLYTQNNFECSILADNRENAYIWLSENGHGGIIKDYVHPMTLQAWAKEQIQEGHALPELFKYRFFSKAIIRKG